MGAVASADESREEGKTEKSEAVFFEDATAGLCNPLKASTCEANRPDVPFAMWHFGGGR